MNLKATPLIAITFLALLSACKHPVVKEKQAGFVLSDTMLAHTGFATVTKQKVSSEMKFFGKVTADEDKLVEVFPLVGGNVIDVNVELGDFVEKGKALAVIRSSEVAEWERENVDAQSDLQVAEKNLKVAQDLFEGKLNSERDVISARKDLEKAQAELNRIQSVLSIYGITSTSEYIVKSPISGFVIEKHITRDMQFRSDRTENIFTIARIDEVWVMVNVSESLISHMQEGLSADITTLSYPDKVFHGKVDRIFNILDPQTKSMKVRVRLANPGFVLKPEMNTVVVVNYEEPQEMLAVPSEAIVFDNSRYYAMVYKDPSHIETHEVEVYQQTGKTTYIKSGLKEGEKVITKNLLLIYDALND